MSASLNLRMWWLQKRWHRDLASSMFETRMTRSLSEISLTRHETRGSKSSMSTVFIGRRRTEVKERLWDEAILYRTGCNISFPCLKSPWCETRKKNCGVVPCWVSFAIGHFTVDLQMNIRDATQRRYRCLLSVPNVSVSLYWLVDHSPGLCRSIALLSVKM